MIVCTGTGSTAWFESAAKVSRLGVIYNIVEAASSSGTEDVVLWLCRCMLRQ